MKKNKYKYEYSNKNFKELINITPKEILDETYKMTKENLQENLEYRNLCRFKKRFNLLKILNILSYVVSSIYWLWMSFSFIMVICGNSLFINGATLKNFSISSLICMFATAIQSIALFINTKNFIKDWKINKFNNVRAKTIEYSEWNNSLEEIIDGIEKYETTH